MGDAEASILCAGAGGVALAALGGTADGCGVAGLGRAMARFGIWAIWMQAFAMLESQVRDGTGLATWSCRRVSMSVAVWHEQSSVETFGKGTL
jgi:hypothetical protein